ncbi:hypothetical protein FHR33_008265 [Nonomuraea dietziae]|uniref:Uncharacterized protein n=1 Tax=Nonomuraea dietziae TaxID=65515 RepID=A0A7W5VHY3_9ACTN|nr:hypothetical protein [Nonomuraea dietziae]
MPVGLLGLGHIDALHPRRSPPAPEHTMPDRRLSR